MWYYATPRVEFSSFKSWKAIGELYTPHYFLDQKDHQKLQILFRQIKLSEQTDTLTGIIDFVQNDIRYLGFEDGINAQKPMAPATVIKQRFGDCKAKSFLLAELIKSLGYKAHPVLVNSYGGWTLNSEQPTPNLFNHCIVQIVTDKGNYFVDPTLSNQGGNFSKRSIPQYEYGLVINGDNSELIPLPGNADSRIEYEETYSLDSIGKGANLHVITKYYGLEADKVRSYFSNNNITNIQQEYLNFYSTYYPSVKNDSAVSVQDDPWGDNIFIAYEFYRIDSLWKKSTDDPNIIVSEFFPATFNNAISFTASPPRTMPYAVNYPLNYRHKTIIKMQEPLQIIEDTMTINSIAFKYRYHVIQNDNDIAINHEYNSIKPYLTAEESIEYFNKIELVKQQLGYQITYNHILANKKYISSFPAFIIAIASIVISLYFGLRMLRKKPDENNPGRPLGGWLILLGIALVSSLPNIIVELYKSRHLFNRILFDYNLNSGDLSNDLIQGFNVVTGIVYQPALLVFTILLCICFFKRKYFFPDFVISLFLVNFIISSVHAMISNFTFFGHLGFSREDWTVFIRNLIYLSILVSYLMISVRVKETFTR